MNIPRAFMADVTRVLAARDARPCAALPSGRGLIQVNAEHGAPMAELLVYDEIGYWGVTAGAVIDALKTVDHPELTVRVNSPGGDMFDGIAIYNALQAHPSRVHMVVDSLAASAASFIAMAGDTITMNRASQMMIHDAAGLCMGNAADMEQMRAMLDRSSDLLAGIYASRAGGTAEEWRTRMRAETWFSAEEAVAAGLADGTADKPVKNAARFDLTCFAFAGRDAAPSPLPVGVDSTPTAAAAPNPPAPAWDPDVFRSAMKGAVT